MTLVKINRNNLFYIINRSDFTQWQIYANYPELHYEAFSKTLKGNTIDIGSNVGSFSIVAAKYLASEKSKFKVYSFEPYDEIFNKLLKNIELNPHIKNNIILEKTALSNEKIKNFFLRLYLI